MALVIVLGKPIAGCHSRPFSLFFCAARPYILTVVMVLSVVRALCMCVVDMHVTSVGIMFAHKVVPSIIIIGIVSMVSAAMDHRVR